MQGSSSRFISCHVLIYPFHTILLYHFFPSCSCCFFSLCLKCECTWQTLPPPTPILRNQLRHHFCKYLSLIHSIPRMSPCASQCIYPLLVLFITLLYDYLRPGNILIIVISLVPSDSRYSINIFRWRNKWFALNWSPYSETIKCKFLNI